MPRIRTIKPEFFSSESLGRVAIETRQFFAGLLVFSDDEGRFRAHPRLLAASIFPYDGQGILIVEKGLAELQAQGTVELYEFEGSHYGWIPKFREHQRVDHPTPSKLPPPPLTGQLCLPDHIGGTGRLLDLTPQKHASRVLASPRESSGEEQGEEVEQGEEGKGKGRGTGSPEGRVVVEGLAQVDESTIISPATAEHLLPVFLAWVADVRSRHGLQQEPYPKKPDRLTWWHDIAKLETRTLGWLKESYRKFLTDPFWGKAVPRWPIRGFAKQWNEQLPIPDRRH